MIMISSEPGAGARACIDRIRGDVSTSHQSWALVTWPRVGALDALMEEEAVDQRTASLETDDGVRLTVRASELQSAAPPPPPPPPAPARPMMMIANLIIITPSSWTPIVRCGASIAWCGAGRHH
eukprot:COSAG01_NODE_5384_length_4294_cov_1.988796_6_plen_124_part_00